MAFKADGRTVTGEGGGMAGKEEASGSGGLGRGAEDRRFFASNSV